MKNYISESEITTDEQRENAKLNAFQIYQYALKDKRTLIIKKFDSESYNGPTLNDFIERLNMVFESAKFVLDQQAKDNEEPVAETDLKRVALENAQKEAFDRLNKECEITPVSIDKLLIEEPKAIDKIKEATKSIQGFLAKAIPIIQPNALQREEEYKYVSKRIQEAEVDLTIAKGRPDFINFYDINNITRVSGQRVVGDKPIPSTKRDVAQLPNFVESVVGYTDKATDAFVSQFNGYRHSSYIPLKIHDDFQRQKAASHIAKEMFTELARAQLKTAGVASSSPVMEIKLSSLALLTPGKKYLEPFVQGRKNTKGSDEESEYRQLKESYDALMMYNGREITIDVDGTVVTVKPLINFMNAASNPMGVYASKKGKLGTWQSNLENNINAQGINKFITDSEKHLGIMDPYINNKKTDEFKLAIQALELKLINENKSLEGAFNTSDKKSYAYTLAKEKISSLEEKIYQLEIKIKKERTGLFHKKREEIKEEIIDIGSKLSVRPTPPDKEKLEFKKLYYETVAMTMDGQVEPVQLGARYLLANRAMGNHVDFYCKSGEDRTGRMNDLVEELCEFSRAKGHYPSYNFETKDIEQSDSLEQKKIALVVNAFSASADNNDQNSHGARGRQIKDSEAEIKLRGFEHKTFKHKINDGLPFKSGNMMGNMAKGVFNNKALLKVSLDVSMANLLMEKNSLSQFDSRLIRAADRDAYEKTKHESKGNDKLRVEIRSDKNSLVTYEGVRLKKKELIVISKEYALTDTTLPPIVGCLEQNHRGVVSDFTKISKQARASTGSDSVLLKVNRELAIEAAKALLSQPLKPTEHVLLIQGSDQFQVARIHAAVLYLKRSHPSLKNVEVELTGYSERPETATRFGSQKKKDDAFICATLGGSDELKPLIAQTKELGILLEKQRQMKLVVKASRGSDKDDDINLVEGGSIRP